MRVGVLLCLSPLSPLRRKLSPPPPTACQVTAAKKCCWSLPRTGVERWRRGEINQSPQIFFYRRATRRFVFLCWCVSVSFFEPCFLREKKLIPTNAVEFCEGSAVCSRLREFSLLFLWGYIFKPETTLKRNLSQNCGSLS